MVYPLLDGLRGVAAVAVATRHMPFFFDRSILPATHLAVDLFFVLSGFVVAHAYDGRLAEGMGWRRFMARRLIRLYPMFLLAAVLGAPIAIGLAHAKHLPIAPLLVAIPLSLLMLPSPVTAKVYPSVGAAWSLLFEIVINFLYALFWRQLGTRVLIAVTATGALMLCASVWRFGSLDVGYYWPTVTGGLARVLYGFPLGVLLYRLHQRGFRMPRVPALLLVAALLLVFRAGSAATELACTLLVLPLIVITAVSSTMGPLATRISLFMGAISYPVYLLHPSVARAAQLFTLKFLQGAGAPELLCIGVLVVTALVFAARVVELIYDLPMRGWLTRLTGQRHPQATGRG